MMYQGVVEDRNDPLQLGRVKVRFVGLHTEVKQDLPYPMTVLSIASHVNAEGA